MVSTTVYELDADGNVVFQLKRPFKIEPRPTTEQNRPVQAEHPVHAENTAAAVQTDGVAQISTSNSEVDATSRAETMYGEDQVPDLPEGEKGCLNTVIKFDKVHFKVSGTHMALASRPFKSMLRGTMKEALDLRNQGNTTISLPDDDADAFLILLNIIHLNNRLVPTEVDFSDLCQLATLVDKYELHDATRHYARLWLDKLRNQLQLRQHAIIWWLWVSWVFEDADMFEKVTAIVLNSCVDISRYDAFSIPESIIASFKQRRAAQTAAVTNFLIHICDLRETFLNSPGQCGYYCNAYVLSLVTRLCREQGIANDSTDLPVDGKTYNKMTAQIQKSLVKPMQIMIEHSSQKIRDDNGWRLYLSRTNCPNLKLVKSVKEKYVLPATAGLQLSCFLTEATDARRGRKKNRVA